MGVVFLFLPTQAYAAISCTASVNPTSVSVSSTNDFTFTVTNTDPSNSIVWVKITRPSGNFALVSSSIGGWSVNLNDTDITIYGSSIGHSESASFVISVSAGDSNAPSASWTVQASDTDESGAIPCSGSPGTAITGGTPSGPTVGDITISNVTSSTVTLSFTTSESTSISLSYGTTTSYGSTKSDTSATSHSITVDGLSANTTYHFNIVATGASGTTTTADYTFVTAKEGQTGTTTTVTTTTTRMVTPTPTPVDTSPPRVSVSTDFSKPFTVAPIVKGSATDQSGVASLEYSLDNGKSWLPVETITSLGKTSTTFAFTPESLLDDNYILKIRAADLKGNTGETAIGTLVIDRLPPRMGGNVASLGPQILSPSPDGSYVVPVGLDLKLTLSAAGGPTSIELSYLGDLGNLVKIPLNKNPDNGLWSGALRFDAPGSYVVTAHAVDGAGNRAERDIATFVAAESGRVTSGGQPVRAGRVTVYYLDTLMKRFVVWDGSSYGQLNPQPLTSDGRYTLYLPPGTYYIDVSAPGYQSLVTNMFTLADAAPITTNFSLARARAIRIFSWLIPLPDFRETSAVVSVRSQSQANVPSLLVGQEFPYFRLTTAGKTITSFDFRGKPTIITFLNTWLPVATTQMAMLNDVAAKKDINVLVIIPQETASSVYIFGERGQYLVPIAADPDGDLVDPLNLHSLPTHVIVDRKGVITAVQSGVFNKDELFDMIIQ